MELKQVIASAVQRMGLLDFINHPKELISESYYMYKTRKNSSKQHYFPCPQEIIYPIYNVLFCGEIMFLTSIHEGKCYHINVLATLQLA